MEGSELEVIPDWVSSGALANVDQIGMELHILKLGNYAKKTPKEIAVNFLRLVKSLYQIGFRLIAWYPNPFGGVVNQQFNVVEVVFKRNNSGICHGFQS